MPDFPNDVALGVKPPGPVQNFDLGAALKNASEVQSNLAYASNANSEVQKRSMDMFRDQLSSAAQDVIQQPDGPSKTARWNSYLDHFKQQYPQFISDETYKQYHDNPSDLVLHQAMASGTSPATFGEISGQTPRNSAAAQFPYQLHTFPVGTNETTGFPAAQSGAPGSNLWGGPASQGGAPPITGGPAVPQRAATGAAAGPAATDVAQTPNDASADASSVAHSNPYYAEAPVRQIGAKMKTGPGIIQPATDPAAVQARDAGMKEFNEEISPAVAAAGKTRAELGTMKAELQSGKVSTDRLADLKNTVAGYLYSLSDHTPSSLTSIQKLTGSDLSNAEIFNKESTRMGLTFARQTEGAREAVQAIRIALGANPSLLNTAQGNLKIIGIMDQGAKYDQDRGQAAEGYMYKQQDATGTPHLTGFDNYFAGAHPPAAYISKAVPYEVQRTQDGKVNPGELQNGVTYNLPPAQGDKQQTPRRGVWNATKGHFDPVVQ